MTELQFIVVFMASYGIVGAIGSIIIKFNADKQYRKIMDSLK